MPGSKSETIRALVAAALAEGRSHIYGALDSEDSEAMIRVLRGFGVGVETIVEPWVVDGTGGYLVAPDHEIDVGESGLTARIALVMAALAEGTTVISGRGRLPSRPFAALVDALHGQGVDITTSSGSLPMTITGQGGLWGGPVAIDCSASSQFATALLLAAPLTTEPMSLRIEGLSGSAGYLDVTTRTMEAFGARISPTITGYDINNDGYRPTDYVVEPDASAAAYPLVAAAITRGRVIIDGLSPSSAQPDVLLVDRLVEMGCHTEQVDSRIVLDGRGVDLVGIETDMSAAPDSSLALAVACLFASGRSRIVGLASLRLKESDRLAAMQSELTKLGARVWVEQDALAIERGELAPAAIDPHGDHRVAMSCALVGLVVEGVEVQNPGVANKTWPGFWGMLDALATDAE